MVSTLSPARNPALWRPAAKRSTSTLSWIRDSYDGILAEMRRGAEASNHAGSSLEGKVPKAGSSLEDKVPNAGSSLEGKVPMLGTPSRYVKRLVWTAGGLMSAMVCQREDKMSRIEVL